jgi:hypothetical protein
MALGVLVAFDDFLLRHLLEALLGGNPLHVSNGLARRFVDHAK